MEIPTSKSSPTLSALTQAPSTHRSSRISRNARASVLCNPRGNRKTTVDPNLQAQIEIEFKEDDYDITPERLERVRSSVRFNDPSVSKLTARERKTLFLGQKLIHEALIIEEEEDDDEDDDNNNDNNNDTSAHNNNNNTTPTMPQAITMAGAVGAAVVGAPLVAGVAAVAGAAGVAGAVMSTAGASSSMSSSSGVQKRGNGQERRAPPGQQQRGRRMCRRCQAFKPPRAHHCSICKRCIVKMDHHCPWVNNCVGIGNHKYFLLFIFYTCLSCLYSFLFVIYRFVHCIGHVHSHHHGPRCVDHPTDLLPLVGLAVEALLFGLFTMCMMCDQWDVVTTNLTHIDRLKGETHGHHGRRSDPPVPGHNGGGYSQLPQHYNQGGAKNLLKNARAGINEVFGTGRHLLSSLSGTSSSSANAPTSSRFHYTWLSPLHRVCFPDTVRDDIFGYCRPVCGGGAARRLSLKSMEMVGRGGEKGRGAGAAEIV
mmetsp:Transcript_23142/g.41335  ORF Transcript_23142/g.41335 Transcript_23142/m.41335 type:complete len:482 (-) Transcript_23142:581-2026(-)